MPKPSNTPKALPETSIAWRPLYGLVDHGGEPGGLQLFKHGWTEGNIFIVM
jgi:hypothetical protein